MTRDPATGQYAYDGDFDRICGCGHTLGDHVHGGWDCLQCSPHSLYRCEKFKPATPLNIRAHSTKDTSNVG